MTQLDPEYLEARLDGLSRELDHLMGEHGRKLSRRMIVEMSYKRGWEDGQAQAEQTSSLKQGDVLLPQRRKESGF
jgi:hypothetical protein